MLDPVFGPPVVTIQEVDCEIAPRDRGWILAEHAQDCHLWELEYPTVPADVDDPEGAVLAQLEDTPAWSAAPQASSGQRTGCREIAESSVPANENIPVRNRQVRLFATTTATPDGYLPCVPRSGNAHRSLGELTVTDPAATISRADLPEGVELLVIVREVWISSSSLGCLPLPPFCEPATTTVRPPAFE